MKPSFITKETFTQYLAEYSLKWIYIIRKHLREHLDEYYNNPVIVEMVANWHKYNESHQKQAFQEFKDGYRGVQIDEYDRDRADRYSEVLYEVLHLGEVNDVEPIQF